MGEKQVLYQVMLQCGEVIRVRDVFRDLYFVTCISYLYPVTAF